MLQTTDFVSPDGPPLVTMIMTIVDPLKVLIARSTVNQLLKQSYRPLELLVVNGSGTPVITANEGVLKRYAEAGVIVRELMTPRVANAATMRNIGIDEATGSWLVATDYDDWAHPHRLLRQMASRDGDRPVALKYQTVIDIQDALDPDLPTDEAISPKVYLKQKASGLPSTLLFPKQSQGGVIWKYSEAISRGEHSELQARLRLAGLDTVIVQNRPANIEKRDLSFLYSAAIFHGANELDSAVFFEGCEFDEEAFISADEVETLRSIFATYKFVVK